jgi:hypothetical protein
MNSDEIGCRISIFIIRGYISQKIVSEECLSSSGLVTTEGTREAKEASLPLLTEQEKSILQSEIFKHFPILEANLRLFDGPLTIIVRDLSSSLPTKKDFNHLVLIVISWLQKINYFQTDHRPSMYRISRSEEVTKFFFEYYHNAATALEEMNCLDTNMQSQFNRLSNLLDANHGLFVFVPVDVGRFHELLVNFIASYEEMIKSALFYSSKYNYFYFMFAMNHCTYSDRLRAAMLNCELTSSLNNSAPPAFYTTNEEINEQIFQSMHELVGSDFLAFCYFS